MGSSHVAVDIDIAVSILHVTIASEKFEVDSVGLSVLLRNHSGIAVLIKMAYLHFIFHLCLFLLDCYSCR